MSDAAPTFAHLFDVPSDDEPNRLPDSWQPLREKLAEEVKGVKWVAAMPDLATRVGALLDIEIPPVFVKAWKKGSDLRTKLAESRLTPKDVLYLELADHTISVTHHPFITVQVGKMPVKKLEFAVTASFTLRAFVLTIQDGTIREIRTGACEAEGRLEALGLTLVKKQLSPLLLPGQIPIADDSPVDAFID